MQYSENYNMFLPGYGDPSLVDNINDNTETIDGLIHDNRTMMAPSYDSAETYAVGDIVERLGKLYRCIAETTGTWDATKWTLTTLADECEGGGGGAADVTKTVTGATLEITDAAAAPFVGLTSAVEGTQSGSGTPSPEHVRPITGCTQTAVTVANASSSPSTTTTYTATFVDTAEIFEASADLVKKTLTITKNIIALGSANWTKYTDGSAIYFYTYVPKMLKLSTDEYICTHYAPKSGSDLADCEIGITIGSGGATTDTITIRDDSQADTSASAFKTYLSSGSAKLAYTCSSAVTGTLSLSAYPVKALSGSNYITSTTGDLTAEYITEGYQPLVNPEDMVGATGGRPGAHGLVPAPANGDGSKFLKGDGTWAVPASGATALTGLSDVAVSSPTNGQILKYNTTSSKWANTDDTSAAQLNAMKTGFDGVVYDSPAAMVTGEDQKLQDQINTLSGYLPITLTKVTGWYDNAGFHPNDQYQCATIQYTGNKIYVSTHANSAAKIAVYFSGVPGASTYISSQEAAYPADYGTLTVTDFELQIPNGTQYIVINNRVNAGGFSAKEFTAEYFVDKVEALEDTIADVADAVTGYSNITDTLTIENGYYRDKSGTKAQNSQYENVLIPVQAGEKYKITTAGNSVAVCIIFYNGDPSVSGHYVSYTPTTYPPNYGTLVINDYEVTIADGVTYMAINNQKASSVLRVYKEIIMPVVENLMSYQGKNVLLLGDSITQLGTGYRGWPRYFKEVVKPARMDNVAVIGAWWCDYNNSTVYNGNPQPVGDEQNVIGNQVQKIINNPSSFASSYDVIIIAAGTNDPTSTGTLTTQEINAQFYSGSNVVDLDDVDRSKWPGATRWVTEKLRTLFPTATIIYNTPVLRMDNHDCSRVLNNAAVVRRCADVNSVLLCDTLKCGITMTDAADFDDGLHPSIQGAKKIGKYNARFFTKIFTDYIDE